jgi:hypothetical protein
MNQPKTKWSSLGAIVKGRNIPNLFSFQALQIMRKVKSNRLTYLSFLDLLDLRSEAIRIEQEHLPGLFLEMGAALGGSAIVIASSKKRQRPLRVYDAFEMIPPPSENDGADAVQRYSVIKSGVSAGIGGDRYYGYQDNLVEKVTCSFTDYQLPLAVNQIALIKGYFENTLTVDEPVAFAHIDCDWYDSVMVCLTRITPKLVPGGTLVINDYFDWSGCKKAVDEYFQGKVSEFRFEVKSRLHITRK